MYCVADDNPVSEYVVAVLPVLDTILDHVEPPSADLSISYPVTDELPSSIGAVQERLICDVEVAVAVSPVGELGEVGVGGGGVIVGANVVAKAVLDELPVPILLIADTR